MYAGTNSAVEVCAYGNVFDRSAGATFKITGDFGCDDGVAGLAPVGHYRPNAWGLYDMTGNVWEWTWDRYGPYPSAPGADAGGVETGETRSNRGGSWRNDPAFARVANRDWYSPGFRGNILGLRLARSLP